MKKLVLRRVKEEKKFFEEKQKKVFTKKKVNSKMKKNYNLLSKDYNSDCEREGLYMKETKVILERLKKQLNWKLKIVVKIFPKTCIKLYRKGMADCFNYYNKDGTF